MVDDAFDLRVGDVDALHAGRRAGVGGLIEHISLAQQILGPYSVEDDARIDSRSHGEGEAGREVGLDQAGDHVGRRPLRGHHQMDARGPRHLRQPA